MVRYSDRSSRTKKALSKNTRLRTFKPSKTTVPTGVHSLNITDLSDDGRGIGRLPDENKPVFVRGALPAETVEVKFTASHSKYADAQLLSVSACSSARVDPECTHFLQCGGCSLQHLNYDRQVLHKQRRLEWLMGRLDADAKAKAASPLLAQPYQYRHRARLAVARRGKKAILGFRQAESHELVAIDNCPVLQPGLNKLLQSLKPLLQSLTRAMDILDVSISTDDNRRSGVLIQAKKILPQADLERLSDFSAQYRLYLEVQARNEVFWQSDSENSTFEYLLPDYAQKLYFHLSDFTQVNPAINRQLIARALAWLELTPSDKVADFFCGIGNFTLPIATQAGTVTGFELAQSMVVKAQNNAESNRVDNAAFYCRDLMSEHINIAGDFNKVLLDPPRAGAFQLCCFLAKAKPSRIVYISCNPQTLHRDAEQLLAAGYRLQQYALADMFPQTQHSEAMALFTLPT